MDKIQENWDKFKEKEIKFHKFPTQENCPYSWENTIWNGGKITPKRFKIDWDWRFFAIIPALNINIHSLDLEFEWLFLGVYWNFWRKTEIYTNIKPTNFECYWKENRKIGENDKT